MNKTEVKEKELYEAPAVLDIKPVSIAVKGDSDHIYDPNANGDY